MRPSRRSLQLGNVGNANTWLFYIISVSRSALECTHTILYNISYDLWYCISCACLEFAKYKTNRVATVVIVLLTVLYGDTSDIYRANSEQNSRDSVQFESGPYRLCNAGNRSNRDAVTAWLHSLCTRYMHNTSYTINIQIYIDSWWCLLMFTWTTLA